MAGFSVSRLSLIAALHIISLASITSAQTGTGIIGYGITYWRDVCCQACFDTLSPLYLNCTTFSEDSGDMDGMDMGDDSMDGMMMGTTSDECRASSTPWLESMAYCIQTECNAHGYTSDARQETCFVVHALGGDASGPTLKDSLPATAPTVELTADAMWLNETSLVNADLYYSTYGTEKNFADSEYIHTKYDFVILFTTIGIILVAGIFAQMRSAFPGFQRGLQTSKAWAKLQQYIFLPSLLGRFSHHHEPSLGGFGYTPSRPLSIFIGVFVVLNIVLSCVSYETFSPSIYWNSPQFNLCEFIGNRTGQLSLVNLALAVLFAGRNNILINLTGWSQSTFLTLHRWTARVSTVQAVVHSIVYTYAYFTPGYDGAAAYAAEVAMPFYWWGIVATIAFCLAASFAVLPLRTRWYEVFLVVHIALAILALVGCWYHLVPHFGFTYGYQTWLFITFAFWACDRLIRIGRVFFFSRMYIGAPPQQATVEAVPGSSNLVHVTVYPRTWSYGPGQHTFLYFPSLGWGKGWESHPFSVAAWNNKDARQPLQALQQEKVVEPSVVGQAGSSSSDAGGVDDISQVHEKSAIQSQSVEVNAHHHQRRQSITAPRPSIEFLIRTQGGMTAWLQEHASLGRGRAVDLPLYTEGPYAGHRATLQPLNVADTVLCIVGGIGITHVLSILQEYVSAAKGRSVGGEESSSRTNNSKVMTRATRFILAWCAQEHALLDHVQDRFLVPAAQVGGLEYQFWCTAEDGATAAVSKEAGEAVGRVKVTPGRMNVADVVRSSVEVGRLTTVVVCGPGSMADEANRAVVQAVHDGFHVDSMEESFKW